MYFFPLKFLEKIWRFRLRHFRSPSFPVAPALENMASGKRFISPQFLNPRTVGKTPRTED
jgi:hypothetical protein